MIFQVLLGIGIAIYVGKKAKREFDKIVEERERNSLLDMPLGGENNKDTTIQEKAENH